MVAKVVGKRSQTYTQKSTGEVKNARELHVIREPYDPPRDGFEGVEVECIWCGNIDISKIPVGAKCNFEYERRTGRNGEYAALVGITVLDK